MHGLCFQNQLRRLDQFSIYMEFRICASFQVILKLRGIWLGCLFNRHVTSHILHMTMCSDAFETACYHC